MNTKMIALVIMPMKKNQKGLAFRQWTRRIIKVRKGQASPNQKLRLQLETAKKNLIAKATGTGRQKAEGLRKKC